ncbi:transcription termination factor, mitochondrial isoform X4 [Spodoptera litura]|uniref:Transcription termination factor, mitochondrial isoform X4 n=1 Tax=Spodoptera litura TaxID=69820 RepID=A0A9J7IPS5_SPOLT|nr:transcription termination factor, mitochondrial isoform X4 [Spodoptera litura]
MAIRTIISKLKPTYLSLCSSAFKIIPTTIIQNVLSRPPCDIFIKVPIVSIASYATRTKTTEKSGLNATKAKIILALNFQSAEDALPFYKLPLKTLIHVLKITKNDESKGFCKNRLYYIASRLKVPPSVLSEKLAKRTFIYSLSFDWIEKALDVLIEMNVASDRILRDLWVLKYHHETVHERLLKVKNLGIDNLYPWMVRCSEDILNRHTRARLTSLHRVLGRCTKTQGKRTSYQVRVKLRHD